MSESASIAINAQGDLTVTGDVVGRDKIINNIQNIVQNISQRALTTAEASLKELEIERQALADGLSAYARSLQQRVSEAPAATGNPYKGLLTYGLSDSELFFGRKAAKSKVLERLNNGPLTILHSESGAGKSSLIQAGLMPQIIADGHLPVLVRPYTEPDIALKRALLGDLQGKASWTLLHDFLRQVGDILGPGRRLYIFLDQAEELFTVLPDDSRAEFVRGLAECLSDPALNVRWILAMRTEFFGALANFRPAIPNPFANDYRLNRLSLEEAREVVEAPARLHNLAYEAGLVDVLLKDLSVADAEADSSPGKQAISPPEIQIACSALYDALPAADAPTTVRTITRAHYQALGGAQGALQNHLDHVLTRDIEAPQRAAARRLLEGLIRSDGRRDMQPRSYLLAEVAPLLKDLPKAPAPEAQFDALIGQLIDSHLVRRLEPSEKQPEMSYELTHDYLVTKITVDPAVQARKSAQEIIEQARQAYRQHKVLLSADQLAIVAPRRSELILDKEARELLERSEEKIRRAQRLAVGGVGLVILLMALAAIAIGLAFQAQAAQGVAVSTQRAAEGAALMAATSQAVAVGTQQAAEAQAQQASLQVTQSARQVDLASAGVATAQAAATAALGRAADAKQVVRNLFLENGLAPVSDNPTGLAYDRKDGWLWATLETTNRLKALDPKTGDILREVSVGRRPNALAYDGALIWVANRLDHTVQAVDPGQGTAGITITVAGEPAALLAVPERSELWVITQNDNGLQVIDLNQKRVRLSLALDAQPLALTFGANRVWVSSRDAPRNRNRLVAINPDNGQVTANVSVGARPSALAFDGVHLWIADQDDDSVQVAQPSLDENVKVSPELKVGSRPGALLWDGTWLWILNQGDHSVRALDPVVCGRRGKPGADFSPATCAVSASIAVGNLPQALAYTGEQLWVANYSDLTVQALDPVAAFSIQVGNGPRRLAAATVDGQPQVWVANQKDNTLQSIDLDTKGDPLTGLTDKTLQTGKEPRSVVYDGQSLWVTASVDDRLIAMNPADGRWTAQPRTGSRPRAILYDSAHQLLWFANNSGGTVQSVRLDNGVAGAQIPVDKGPFDLASDGQRLWVSSSVSNTVQSIDPVNQTASPPVRVCANPGAMAFDGTWLWVACYDDNLLQLVDPATHTAGPTISVGAGPSGLSFDPATKRIWVANYKDSTVQWVTLEGASGHPQVSKPIRVDSGPIFALFIGNRLWVANFNVGRVQYIVVRENGQ